MNKVKNEVVVENVENVENVIDERELRVIEREKEREKLIKREKELMEELKEIKKGLGGGSNKERLNVGVGKFVYLLMEEGFSDKEILSKVCEKYNNENTSMNCVRWYRNKYKKGEYKI